MQSIDRIRSTVSRISPKGDRRRAGNAGERIPHRVTLSFVAAEEKDLVLNNGTAQCTAKLLEVSGRLRLVGGIEVVARIQRGVAAKSVGATVQLIGARLQPDVNDGSGLPAVFRTRILLEVEFGDGIDGQNGRRISGDAGTVDNALAGERFTVE